MGNMMGNMMGKRAVNPLWHINLENANAPQTGWPPDIPGVPPVWSSWVCSRYPRHVCTPEIHAPLPPYAPP